jgi:hypothetical protein
MHYILGVSISYWDLIKFLYLADTPERGDRGWKQAQRQGDFRDNSIIIGVEAFEVALSSWNWYSILRIFVGLHYTYALRIVWP